MALRRCFRFRGAAFSFASSSLISSFAWMMWEAVAAYARPLLTILSVHMANSAVRNSNSHVAHMRLYFASSSHSFGTI
eukprot:6982503-Lingulodinium_polyedra.AAC.1